MKKVFVYDNDGYFLGESFPQIDPLESQKTGRDIFINPAYSTEIEPPEEKAGFRIKWNGEAWEYEKIQIEPEPEQQDLSAVEQEQKEPTLCEQREKRKYAYFWEVDPITSHIQRLRDEAEPDEQRIAELIEERAEKVAEIKERYPYPEEVESIIASGD